MKSSSTRNQYLEIVEVLKKTFESNKNVVGKKPTPKKKYTKRKEIINNTQPINKKSTSSVSEVCFVDENKNRHYLSTLIKISKEKSNNSLFLSKCYDQMVRDFKSNKWYLLFVPLLGLFISFLIFGVSISFGISSIPLGLIFIISLVWMLISQFKLNALKEQSQYYYNKSLEFLDYFKHLSIIKIGEPFDINKVYKSIDKQSLYIPDSIKELVKIQMDSESIFDDDEFFSSNKKMRIDTSSSLPIKKSDTIISSFENDEEDLNYEKISFNSRN